MSETASKVLSIVAKQKNLTKSAYIEQKILEDALKDEFKPKKNEDAGFRILSRDYNNFTAFS
jgi:hypothetical protein